MAIVLIHYLKAGIMKNAVPVALAWLLLTNANLGVRLEAYHTVLTVETQEMLHKKK